MKKNIFVCFLVFCAGIAFCAGSGDDVIKVTASRVEDEIPEEKQTQHIKVVSAEEIKESGSKTVSDVLRSVPEITVNAQSSANPTETVSMQGLSSEYVKILVDGIAAGTDIDGSTSISSIPVEDIERIEVISGAGSVMYGSSAMGGVVNIITKKAKNEYDGVKAHFNLGDEFSFSPQTKNIRNYSSAGLSVAGEKLSGNVSGSFDWNPGKQKSSWDALSQDYIDYYESAKKNLAFVRAGGEYTDDWGKVGAYGLFNNSCQICNFTKTGYDKGSTMEYSSSRVEGGINGKYIFDSNLNFAAFSSIKSYRMDNIYNVSAGSYSSSKKTQNDSLNWESDFRTNLKTGSYNEILFGVNALFDTIDGNTFDEKKSQWQFAVFAQDTIKVLNEKLSIVPGARFTVSPGNDGEKNLMQAVPNLGIKYQAGENTTLKFSYGMGYKIPSLRQKYWIFRHNYAPGSGNFILYGNADLKPEKSHAFNFSTDTKILNIFSVSTSAYFNYIIDLIDSVVTDAESTPQIREYQNVDKAVTYGAGLNLFVDLDRFSAKAGYNFTVSKSYDAENEKWLDMALRSAHRISASASYKIPVLEAKISANAEWNSPQLLSTGGSLKTPDYFMAGATLSKLFFEEKLELYIRANNIFNNLNFKNGSNGENQKSYYGLEDGTTLTFGTRLKF